ncbi:MAG: DUF1549 domain-containing protein [Alphaproteobacteria bacterium]|nr:DUF1549 domain-containing protein [Alphaproteobacteria bacterium]
MIRTLTLLTLLGLAGCGEPEPTATSAEPHMKAVDLLRRASLDLRGVLPSVDDIATVEANPDAVEGIIDDYLQDERFGPRVRDLFADIYRTRTENYTLGADDFGLSDDAAFWASVGEEPLYMLSWIAEHDLPYTDLVTADWTMADERLASIWPLERLSSEPGWQQARYTDGRPTAGVLSTNAMWWRYTSTASNANRARANAVSRIFLCHDYLSRPIDFDRNVNLLDQEAVASAIRNNPSCVNCHNSLDPLAGFFFGFFYYDDYDAAELTSYHPERELLWRTYTDVTPGFYGEEALTLNDLGRKLAGDHRYVECAVEQVYEGMLRRDAGLDDTDRLTVHREAFLDGGLTLRALFRSVVDDPRYRAGATDTEGFVSRKMMTPDQLATAIGGLTGFSLTYAGYDMLRSDLVGYRTLAGGADGTNVTEAATSPNTTLLLVQERLSQASAWYAAERDATGSAQLFTKIDFTETPDTDPDAMVAQIQDLHLRLFGNRVEADGPEVTANLELWAQVYEVERDTIDAWAAVLSVLLRDPDFLLY